MYSLHVVAQAKALDRSLYTDLTELDEALSADISGLSNAQQNIVDEQTAKIKAALDNLVLKPADYSRVNEQINTVPEHLEYYTDETVNALNEILSGIDYGLDITKQEVVDSYAEQLQNAISALEYKPADYTKIDELFEEISGYDSTLYENYDDIYYNYILAFYYGALQEARDMYTKISEQDEVNKLYDQLVEYKNMLILKDAKVARFELKNGAAYKKSGGVTYIKGLNTGLLETTLKNTYFEMENVNVTITKAVTGRYIGTGSTVTVTDLNDNVIGEYVILIYGDVNGDGLITARDINDIENQIMSVSELTAAGRLAANVSGGRIVTAADGKLIKTVISGSGVLDQSAGSVS